MSKVTLTNLANLQNESTAVSAINANNAALTTAIDNTLSRDGTSPNTMGSSLDMNSYQILNLAAPTNNDSPVRLSDVASISAGTFTVNTLPTGGATNTILHKASATNYDAAWTLTPSGLTSIGATSGTFTTTNTGTGGEVFTGATSGTTTLKPTAIASGIVTLPAATDTLVGKATTDTFTNKTLDTAGTGNVLKINGTTISAKTGTGSVVLATTPTITTPNIVGTATNDSAAAASVGEYKESVIAVGSAIALTYSSVLGTNSANLTSLSLTAGDWEADAVVTFVGAAAGAAPTAYGVGLSTTTLVFDQTNGRTVIFPSNTMSNANTIGTQTSVVSIPSLRFSLAGTTTVYCVVQVAGATSSITAYGILRARRIR